MENYQDENKIEEKLEKEWDRVMSGCGVGYGKDQMWLKRFVVESMKEYGDYTVKKTLLTLSNSIGSRLKDISNDSKDYKEYAFFELAKLKAEIENITSIKNEK